MNRSHRYHTIIHSFIQIVVEFTVRIKAVGRLIVMCLQVTPLTALKFAELAARAGLPKGVINILPGSGWKNASRDPDSN